MGVLICVREKNSRVREMKLSKLPIILSVAAMIVLLTVSVVHAQNPIPMGTFYQPTPFEAIPTVDTLSNLIGASRPFAYDGGLDTSGNVYPSGALTVASWTFMGYTAPPAEFTIGWVDLKIKYSFPTATVDDAYRFRFSTDGGATWIDLTSPVSGAASKFDTSGVSVSQVKEWAHIAEPQNGVWEWADLAALRMQVYWTRGATTWDGTTRKMNIFEIFADVYEDTLPTAAGVSVSVQPPQIPAKETLDYATDFFFVDVVASGGLTSFAGYQFILDFDTTVLTPVAAFSYYPMTDTAVFDLSDEFGYVSIAMSIPTTDPIFTSGITVDQFSMARIYFTIDDSPTDPGMGIPAGLFSPLTLRPSPDSIIVDVTGAQIPYTGHSGVYGGGIVPEFPFGAGIVLIIAPLIALGYVWRTRRKVTKP